MVRGYAGGPDTPCLPPTPFHQEILERDHAPRSEATSRAGEGYLQSVLPPPPHSLPQAREKGCSWPLLGADDVARPGLVLGARRQVCDDHLHGLQLLVLGRDGAHLVGDLVAFHRHVLPFHAAEWGKALSAQHSAELSRGMPHPGHGSYWSEGHPRLLGELPAPHPAPCHQREPPCLSGAKSPQPLHCPSLSLPLSLCAAGPAPNQLLPWDSAAETGAQPGGAHTLWSAWATRGLLDRRAEEPL